MRPFSSGTNAHPEPRPGGVPTNWGGKFASSTRFAAIRALHVRTMSRSLSAMYWVVALLGLAEQVIGAFEQQDDFRRIRRERARQALRGPSR